MTSPVEKLALVGLTCLALAGCDSKPEARDEPVEAKGSKAADTQPVYAREALEDEAWCMALQKRPGLEKHLGKATFTETQHVKPAKDQCAYFGEDGTLEMGIVAVAENAAIAEVLFDALTAGPPEDGATPEAIEALRAKRLGTYSARLEELAPKDPQAARKQLQDMVGQTLYVGKTYEEVDGIADQASLQTQKSKALGFDMRYLYLREGNAILMFLTRPQGEHAPWEDAYGRLRGALPDVLEHVRHSQGA